VLALSLDNADRCPLRPHKRRKSAMPSRVGATQPHQQEHARRGRPRIDGWLRSSIGEQGEWERAFPNRRSSDLVNVRVWHEAASRSILSAVPSRRRVRAAWVERRGPCASTNAGHWYNIGHDDLLLVDDARKIAPHSRSDYFKGNGVDRSVLAAFNRDYLQGNGLPPRQELLCPTCERTAKPPATICASGAASAT